MEGSKSSIKLFDDDFKGLDYKSSDLKKDASFLRAAQNVQYGESDGIRSRGGAQVFSTMGLVFGIYNHAYLDRVTGETKQDLLGFGGHLFKLSQRTLTLSGATLDHYYDPDDDEYVARALDIGTGAVLYSQSYQTARYSEGSTILSFAQGLDAALITNTIDLKNTIEIDGDQTAVAGAIVINCTFVDVDVGTFISGYNYTTNALHWFPITAKTASSITIASYFDLDVKDGQVWGVGASPISSLPYTGSGLSSGLVYPFYFWEGIPWGGWPLDFGEGIFNKHIEDYSPLSSDHFRPVAPISLNNKCCFSMFTAFDDTVGYVTAMSEPISAAGKPFVYDGQNVYRLGVPRFEDWRGSPTVSAPATGGTGRWRYIATVVQLDNQDVEWESNPSEEMTNNVGGTGAGTTLTIPQMTDADPSGIDFFNIGVAIGKNALQAGVTTIEVDAFASLFVGDRACFIDNSGDLQIRRITGTDYTGATGFITIDGGAVDVPANAVISNGLFYKIYRTEEYGNIFYEVTKQPMSRFTASLTYVDTVSDANLGDAYIEIEPGEEHDLPPAMNYLCEHQGKMVGAGSVIEPNTVYWNGVDGEHYWPRAYNNVDIPSGVRGPIKAIGSDDDLNLAVFKDYGYYSILGDLQERSISIKKVKEGDYGVSSHNSLVRINGVLVCVGYRGVVAVQGGQLDWKGFLNISPAIRKNSSIDVSRAVAINDSLHDQYLLYIPPPDLDADASDRIVLAYNYESERWYNWTTQASFDMAGGMAIWNDRLLCCSRRAVGGSSDKTDSTGYLHGGVIVEMFDPVANENIAGDFYNYANVDLGLAVQTRVFTSFDCMKDPSLDKLVQYVRVWQVAPTFFVNGTQVDAESVPISQEITITVHKNWKINNLTTTPSRTFTFDTEEVVWDELIVNDELVKSLAVEIVHEAKTEPMYITGIEIGYCLNSSAESRRNS